MWLTFFMEPLTGTWAGRQGEIWPGGDRVTGAGRSPYRVTGRVTLTGTQGHRESRLGTVIGNWPVFISPFRQKMEPFWPVEWLAVFPIVTCQSVGRSAWGCLLIWGREDNMLFIVTTHGVQVFWLYNNLSLVLYFHATLNNLGFIALAPWLIQSGGHNVLVTVCLFFSSFCVIVLQREGDNFGQRGYSLRKAIKKNNHLMCDHDHTSLAFQAGTAENVSLS